MKTCSSLIINRRANVNGMGMVFGPKDPGKERDNIHQAGLITIIQFAMNWPVENISDEATVRDVLQEIKTTIAILLRYEKIEKKPVGYCKVGWLVPRNARAVLVKCGFKPLVQTGN